MQVSNNKSANNTESNLLSKILFRYLPYWPLFLVLMLISAGTAYFYLNHYRVPLYEARASILIKDENKGVDDSRALESFNILSTKKIVENETEVLQSRSLFDTVVHKLGLYAQIFEKDRFKTQLAYETSPIVVDVKKPNEINEVYNLPIAYNASSKKVTLVDKSYPLNSWVKTPYGELKFIANQYQTTSHNDPLFLSLIHPRSVTGSLAGQVVVYPSNKLSTVIHISLRDQSPKRSENILTELLNAYNQSSLQAKNVMAANTLAFIEGRLDTMAKELSKIEKNIQQYKAGRGAVDISTQGKLFLESVSNNDQQVGNINMQLAVLNQVEKYVTAKERAGSIVPSTLGVTDPVLSHLLETLYKAELDKEKYKNTTAENNPIMLSISDQIQKIKPSILDNIQSQRNSLIASRNNILATTGSYVSALQNIPSKERELLQISRDQNTKNDIYSFLLQKREEAALSSASNVIESRIINQAQASIASVGMSNNMIYAIAIGIAIGLGIMILAFKEVLNRKILFRHEIEKFTSIPIVSEIFQEKITGPVVIQEGLRSHTAEQFRKLRTSFSFIGIDSRRKKLLVTSSISGEGKSFIATNLAISVALTDKKVILIEGDLINPSLTQDLNIKNDVGLSDFLKGETEVESIIKSTSISPNLFIIPSGPLPNNPSELIENGRLREFFNYLSTVFDYIIVDAPPAIPISDAYVLSTYCDATLYVVRHNHTPKIFIQRLDDNNRVNQLKNTAIVFNGIEPRGFNKNFYGYGYGYGYHFKGDNKRLKGAEV